MNHEERQYIAGLLAAGQKPDSIAHALLMRRALSEVEQVAQEIETTNRRMAEELDRIFYTIHGPQPGPVLVSKSKDVETYATPARQEYVVRCKDFAAFCKEMGLPLKPMTEVVEGRRRDVKDYICVWSGRHDDRGRSWVDPAPENARRAVVQAEEAKGPVRRKSAYTPTPDRIEYKPSR